MELNILDTSMNVVKVVDVFDSFIWSERYIIPGDLELYLPITSLAQSYIPPDYYATLKGSDRAMIIESFNLNTDNETGNQFIVKGRSLESILDRRIVKTQTQLSGNLQTGIQTLLNQNAISPSDTTRKITKLTFQASTDPLVTSLTFSDQFHGETLLDVISYICGCKNIGFKITINSSGNFVFQLYSGVDRSFTGSVDTVLFSKDMDNLLSSQYFYSKQKLKTTTMVAGEGFGFARKLRDVAAPGGALTELDRRETFTDAAYISSSYSGGTLSAATYNALLDQRGAVDLFDKRIYDAFDAQIDPTINYIYNDDYSMGDIMQIENEYGIAGKVRIKEYIFSEDKAGPKMYPTLEAV